MTGRTFIRARGGTAGTGPRRRRSTSLREACLHRLVKRNDTVVGADELAQAGVLEHRVVSRPEPDE